MSKDFQKSTLIIGYGNLLRSDDGIGQYIAKAILAWEVPYIKVICTHQLQPEIAENLSTVSYAIFIDAYLAHRNKRTLIYPVFTDFTRNHSSHWCTPQSLLTITYKIYNYYPRSWIVKVPGINFSIGETLSLTSKQGFKVALQRIHSLVQSKIIDYA